MLLNYILETADSTSNLRLKLEALKVLYGVFCTFSGLECEPEEFAETAALHAYDIQCLSDALMTVLCDALDIAKRAEEEATKAYKIAKASTEPR